MIHYVPEFISLFKTYYLSRFMSADPNKKIKIVFTCLDWRLHPQIENYFTGEGDGCDMCVTAGSIKELIDPKTQGFMLNQIEISKNLHNCQAVALTMHMDCGAYGGSGAFSGPEEEISRGKEELRRAKEIIGGRFPELAVKTWLIGLDGKNGEWEISPQEIYLD